METAVMRKLTRQYLAAMGIEQVDEADGVFSALTLLRGSRYDALIVEWGDSGREIVRAVKANPFLQDTAVIVITSDIGDDTLIRIAESGAREVVSRAFLPAQLPLKIMALFPSGKREERDLKIAMIITEEDGR